MAGFLSTVRLPGGYYYEQVHGREDLKELEVLAMGTREQKFFTAASMPGHAKINKLIELCIPKFPKGFNPMDLVINDRAFLLFEMRILSKGPEYDFHFPCENCGKKSRGLRNDESGEIFSLRDLIVHYAEDLYEDEDGLPRDPFSVELPIGGEVVTWRFLTGQDEIAIERAAKQMSSRAKVPANVGDPTLEHRLLRRITHVDGVEMPKDDLMEFVQEKLRGANYEAFRSAVEDVKLGFDLEVEVPCEHCRYPNGPMGLPVSPTFFR